MNKESLKNTIFWFILVAMFWGACCFTVYFGYRETEKQIQGTNLEIVGEKIMYSIITLFSFILFIEPYITSMRKKIKDE